MLSGQKAEDPFTRRSTKPRMHASVQKHSADDLPPGLFVVPSKVSSEAAPSRSAVADAAGPGGVIAAIKSEKIEVALAPKAKTGDLFSAHDFDIKIDLEVPLPCKFNIRSCVLYTEVLICLCFSCRAAQPVVVTPKVVSSVKEAPRRSLNLEDYKKKRGLI